MRNVIFLLIVSILGCTGKKKDNDAQVKWDFYKKNARAVYRSDSKEIPFYSSELVLEMYKEDSLDCFYGHFYHDGIHLNKPRTENSSLVVNAICYDSEKEIRKYYTGHWGVTEQLDDSIEQTETEYLKDLVRNNETCQFLAEY